MQIPSVNNSTLVTTGDSL